MNLGVSSVKLLKRKVEVDL